MKPRKGKRRKRYTDKEILEALRGHPDLTMGEWCAMYLKPSATTICERFGSWNRARRLAGLKPRPKARYALYDREIWEKVRRDYLAGMCGYELQAKYGASTSHIYRKLREMGVLRGVSEARLVRSGGWRRLSHSPRQVTRIVSLPYHIYGKLGFSPGDELEGRWTVRKGKIELHIRKASRRTTE